MARPAISQHLKLIKAAGLVIAWPAGTRRIYALDPGRLAELRRFVESFWEAALGTFIEFAERCTETENTSRQL